MKKVATTTSQLASIVGICTTKGHVYDKAYIHCRKDLGAKDDWPIHARNLGKEASLICEKEVELILLKS